MFLPNSTAPALDAAPQALQAALTDVAENSLFAMVDTIDTAAWRSQLEADAPEPWLIAVVRFEGPFAGSVALTASEALARELGGAFVGHDNPENMSATDVADFLGELANMTCGSWLTRACPQDKFVLRAPDVGPFQSALDGGIADCELFVAINDRAVRVQLRHAPSEA